jgi:hypothetical protein
MDPGSGNYTIGENWGIQASISVPLDQSIIERCKSLADLKIRKGRLDYEIIRIKECATLLSKGYMLHPESIFFPLCSDVQPVSSSQK